MPGIATPDYLTLTDIGKMCHNGEIVPMVDEIAKATTIFNALPWRQSSDALRDVTGKVTKYPTAQFVGLDMGVKASKGDWKQVEEGLAMIESWSEINEKTYNVSPNKEKARWINDQMHIRALAMTAEEGLIYGNPAADPAQPLGFIARFGKVTDYERKANGKVLDYCTLSCGGTTQGAQSSILIVAKNEMGPTLLYPRYKEDNGFMYRHFDFENAKDDAGGNVRVAKSQFQVTYGLSIADTRTAVRIANIEIGNSTSEGKIKDCLYEAFEAIPKIYRGSVEIYAPSKVVLALRKAYSNLYNPVIYDPSGRGHNAIGSVFFDGMEIKTCESMLSTESVVA